jgi:hypothetical protein
MANHILSRGLIGIALTVPPNTDPSSPQYSITAAQDPYHTLAGTEL